MSIRDKVRNHRQASRLNREVSGYLKLSAASRSSPVADRAKSYAEISRRLVQCLTFIIHTFDCRESPDCFPQAMTLLKSLPLTTADYDLARHRLENAQRYADSREAGAAIYELRIMLAWFRSAA